MKKILLLFFLLISTISFAETYKFKTSQLAYKVLQNNRWSDWSDWQDCSCLVVINSDKDIITIYSKETQEYDIVEYLDEESDADGGESIKYLCVNEEGLRCHIRLRVQADGQLQLYVDFNDVMFVYNIEQR